MENPTPFHLLPDCYNDNMMEFHHHHNHSQHTLQQQHEAQPMSRTHQYRKVMKPLLERKRRARINKCLDELKDLMVYALQSEGESITKLEKADVLELTVKHLRKLKGQNALGLTPQATYAGRFKSGYSHCAQEVSKFIRQVPGVDINVSSRLLSHLSSCIESLEMIPPSVLISSTTPGPASPRDDDVPSSTTVSTMTITPMDHNEMALDLSSQSRRRKVSSEGSDSGFSCKDENANNDRSSWRPW